jgi:hypothetical protein
MACDMDPVLSHNLQNVNQENGDNQVSKRTSLHNQKVMQQRVFLSSCGLK